MSEDELDLILTEEWTAGVTALPSRVLAENIDSPLKPPYRRKRSALRRFARELAVSSEDLVRLAVRLERIHISRDRDRCNIEDLSPSEIVAAYEIVDAWATAP